MMKKKDKKKIILISGGSRGLGAALVAGFLKETHHVVYTFSRSQTPLVVKWSRDFKTRFHYETMDLTSKDEIESLILEIEKKEGRLDVLINNAGIAREGVLPLFSDAEIDQVLNTNLKSTLYLTKYASRVMLKKSEGVILNISSIIGVRGYAGLSVYSASKAGLIGMTQSLARELGRRGIRVNCIAPGYLETEMSSTLTQGQKEQIVRRTPLGRLGRPEDIFPLTQFLISKDANFITGQTFVVDGGITC